MAAAETAKLVASLDLKDNLSAGVNKASGSLKKLESTSFKVGQGIGRGLNNAARNIAKIGVAGGVAIAGAVALGVRSLADLQRSQAQTQAVIASTGGKAAVSSQQVRDYAESLENLTTVDDKVIQDGENLLLTFTNIGGKEFPAATKAALDMAVAMAGGNVEAVDLKGTAIQLGKALNDPAKGFTALSKAGVSFDEAQTKILKGTNTLSKGELKHFNLLAKQDKAAANRFKATTLRNKQIASQRLILAELNKEFGKAGEAAGKGPEAVMRRLADAGEGVSQILARATLPALERLGSFLTEKLNDKDFLKFVDEFGTGLGEAADEAVTFLEKVDFKGITDALRTAAGFAKDIIGAFLGAPAWLQTAVITGWGLNKLTGGAVTDIFGTLASGLIKGVLGMNAGVVNINAASVNGLPGGGAVPGGGGAAALPLSLIALPATLAAFGSKMIADITNADFVNAGFTNPDFEAPGGGPFGITSLVHNIGALIGVLQQTPNNTDPTPSIFEGKLSDDITGTTASVDELKGKIADDLSTVNATTGDVKVATDAGAQRVSGAATAAGNNVAAAVRNNRPITNVEVNVSATTVQKTVDVITRYGNPGSDRNQNPSVGNFVIP